MKDFFASILFAHFTATLANSSVKPMESDQMKKVQCNLNYNTNFYAGPNSKKIEQQLEEVKEEIKAMKRNETGGNAVKGPNCTDISQQLMKLKKEILKEIKAITRNDTGENAVKGPNCTNISQQLVELKKEILEEIMAMKRNETRGNGCKVYKDCADVYKFGNNISGVYKINPDSFGEFEVFCDQKTAGGGWTVFQKRRDGSVDFFRGWDDYKRGFGNLNGEFWLGLDRIHRLTVSGSYKLRVDLEDLQGKTAFAEYSSFAVTSERTNYQLSLGKYSGTAGDSLDWHRGMSFTTKDRDNDVDFNHNCALKWKGAWWYNRCHNSNLNGLYLHKKIDCKGMSWYTWKNNCYSVKRSEIKIRPKNF